jgi:CubicO group peptidase (beta-lactamase class C family)
MWWTKTVGDDPAFLAWGFGGQLIQVIPQRGLVIVASCKVVPLDMNAPTLDVTQLQYLADSVIAPLFDR